MSATTEARLLNYNEAGALVGLHPDTLRRMVDTGRAPRPIKFGSSARSPVRFDREVLERWISNRGDMTGIED